jgi:predicted transcriptional regulator
MTGAPDTVARRRRRLRSSHSIIAGILEVCEQETKRTRVLSRANISYSMATEYFSLLIRCGLLQELQGRSLRITEKGRSYLQHFRYIDQMLGEAA